MALACFGGTASASRLPSGCTRQSEAQRCSLQKTVSMGLGWFPSSERVLGERMPFCREGGWRRSNPAGRTWHSMWKASRSCRGGMLFVACLLSLRGSIVPGTNALGVPRGLPLLSRRTSPRPKQHTRLLSRARFPTGGWCLRHSAHPLAGSGHGVHTMCAFSTTWRSRTIGRKLALCIRLEFGMCLPRPVHRPNPPHSVRRGVHGFSSHWQLLTNATPTQCSRCVCSPASSVLTASFTSTRRRFNIYGVPNAAWPA
mmetsp:Transcript_56082/g.114186  ORF Transcript_56082/g.114186 Transcript_56082/m.114186 type:complete len:256 (+) Transcript_56082:143-910(+)